MSTDALTARKEENSRLLREDVAERRTVFRGRPEVIALYTTEKCNLRCTMCARALGQGELQMPRALLGEICDQLFPPAKKVACSAAAGEPLLADFDLILDKALEHGVRVDVVTNGTELTAELYRRAAPVFDHVNVSVDTSVPEVYERIRAGGSFARLEANLRAVADERRRHPDGVLLSLSAVVLRSNLPHLPELVRFAGDVGVDGVILQDLHHTPAKSTPEEDPFTEPGLDAIHAVFDEMRAVAREVGISVAFSEFGQENLFLSPVREKYPNELLGPDLCSFVAQHIGVQPTGEVYPCCYPTDHRLGSLVDQTVDEVWNGESAQRLREAHYSRRGTLFCSGCGHAPHLPERRPARLLELLRDARLRYLHDRNPNRSRQARA